MKTIGLKFPKKKARGKAASAEDQKAAPEGQKAASAEGRKAAPEGQKAASAEDQKAEG